PHGPGWYCAFSSECGPAHKAWPTLTSLARMAISATNNRDFVRLLACLGGATSGSDHRHWVAGRRGAVWPKLGFG
ncbi:hypothetical protein TorRG33x02_324990, partial [Trema orientale]